MPHFSDQSNKKLDTCHPLLQKLFREVVKDDDCTVICGHRSRKEQNHAFDSGASKVTWPNSTHNAMPSNGVDVGPYLPGKGIPWDIPEQFYYFAGKVQAKARQIGIKVRWGGDWDGDRDLKDQKFNDLVHWELVKTKTKAV